MNLTKGKKQRLEKNRTLTALIVADNAETTEYVAPGGR